jgi:hypothetical protein
MCAMILQAPLHKCHRGGRMRRQLQLLHEVLVSVLHASLLPLAERLKHDQEPSQPAACRSELKAHACLCGLCTNGKYLLSCSAALRSLPDLQ